MDVPTVRTSAVTAEKAEGQNRKATVTGSTARPEGSQSRLTLAELRVTLAEIDVPTRDCP